MLWVTVCSPLAQVSQCLPASAPVFPWVLPPASLSRLLRVSPEAAGNIRSTMMLGLVLAESTAIYGFVIALMIMFLLK